MTSEKKLYEVKYEVTGGLYYFGEAAEHKLRDACASDVTPDNIRFTLKEVTARPSNYNFDWVGDEYVYGEEYSSITPILDDLVDKLFPISSKSSEASATEEIIIIAGKKYKLTSID